MAAAAAGPDAAPAAAASRPPAAAAAAAAAADGGAESDSEPDLGDDADPDAAVIAAKRRSWICDFCEQISPPGWLCGWCGDPTVKGMAPPRNPNGPPGGILPTGPAAAGGGERIELSSDSESGSEAARRQTESEGLSEGEAKMRDSSASSEPPAQRRRIASIFTATAAAAARSGGRPAAAAAARSGARRGGRSRGGAPAAAAASARRPRQRGRQPAAPAMQRPPEPPLPPAPPAPEWDSKHLCFIPIQFAIANLTIARIPEQERHGLGLVRASWLNEEDAMKLWAVATLVATEHISVRLAAERDAVEVRVKPKFFTEPLLPFGCHLGLQCLMSHAADLKQQGLVALHHSPSWCKSDEAQPMEDRYYYQHRFSSTAAGYLHHRCTPVLPQGPFRDLEAGLLPCTSCGMPDGFNVAITRAAGTVGESRSSFTKAQWGQFITRSSFMATFPHRKSHMKGDRVGWDKSDMFDVGAVLQAAKPQVQYREPASTPGVTVELRAYQQDAVAWWGQRERDPDKALVPSIAIDLGDGVLGHYNDVTGGLSLHGPCGLHGGILASDMGMGKTVITLASCASYGFRARTPGAPLRVRAYRPGGTLILVPPILVNQWLREVRRICPWATVCVYHGQGRPRDPERIAKYDIVLGSYNTVNNHVERKNTEALWGRRGNRWATNYPERYNGDRTEDVNTYVRWCLSREGFTDAFINAYAQSGRCMGELFSQLNDKISQHDMEIRKWAIRMTDANWLHARQNWLLHGQVQQGGHHWYSEHHLDPLSQVNQWRQRKGELDELREHMVRAERQYMELRLASDSAKKCSALETILWHRVVCDEAHLCSGPRGLSLCDFKATNRWLLSGTPFGAARKPIPPPQISGQLTALFGTQMLRPILKAPVPQLAQLVQQCMLRHEKEDKYVGGDRPLLLLPPKHERLVNFSLSTHERWVYDKVVARLSEVLRPLIRLPTWWQSLSQAGRRLRYMASHFRSVRDDPFEVRSLDWRTQVHAAVGAAGWGTRGNAQDQRSRFNSVTLAELEQVLRNAGCASGLLRTIVMQDYKNMPQDCDICFEAMQLGTDQHPCCITCGHMACGGCLIGLLGQTPSLCPTCRRQFRDHQVYAIRANRDAEGAAAAAGAPSGAAAAAAAAGGGDGDSDDGGGGDGAAAGGRKRKRAGAAAAAPDPDAAPDLGPRPREDDMTAWRELFDRLRQQPQSSKTREVFRQYAAVREDADSPDYCPDAKFLWFTQFETTQRLLVEELNNRGIRHRELRCGAGLQQQQRVLEQFEEDPEVVVLLLSIQVGAVGLNLTTANNIFIIDPPNNVTLERQAIGRCHRMGQGREVHVRKFVATDTIDVTLATAAQRQSEGEAVTSMITKTARDDHDRGHGVALLAKAELLAAFGFTEADVYQPPNHGAAAAAAAAAGMH